MNTTNTCIDLDGTIMEENEFADLRVASEVEYQSALRRIFELMRADPAANTDEGAELARLVGAVDRFEGKRYPITCCAFAAKDCAARMLTLMRALGAFYDLEHAVQWCESRQPALDGQRPVDLLLTEAGAAEVDAIVARLGDGNHG